MGIQANDQNHWNGKGTWGKFSNKTSSNLFAIQPRIQRKMAYDNLRRNKDIPKLATFQKMLALQNALQLTEIKICPFVGRCEFRV